MDIQQKEKPVKILIAGGKLQGVEAAYLAGKCGIETVLIDKNKYAPAAKLCGTFLQMDIAENTGLAAVLNDIDIVIPALENREALGALSNACRITNTVLVFSDSAYDISSSKKKSKALFEKCNVQMPKSWPHCTFPVIAKPVFGSGSEGVKIIQSNDELYKHFPVGWEGKEMLIEQYVEGRQYSIEILGREGKYICLQVTELEIDGILDCKRVIAPSNLSGAAVANLKQIALSIAREIKLNGIMDIEVIYHNGCFTVLEIDARFPSQTPIAVFWSTGFNMIENLVRIFQGKVVRRTSAVKTAILEHFKIEEDTLEVCGEHVIAEADELHIHGDFFGAEEIITDYRPGKNTWRATIVVTGKNRKSALAKKRKAIDGIQKLFGINRTCESFPALPEPAVQLGTFVNG